jgi:hypothetical protein
MAEAVRMAREEALYWQRLWRLWANGDLPSQNRNKLIADCGRL